MSTSTTPELTLTPTRRFAVELVETSFRSSKSSTSSATPTDAPRRKFVPLLEEFSKSSNRKNVQRSYSADSSTSDVHVPRHSRALRSDIPPIAPENTSETCLEGVPQSRVSYDALSHQASHRASFVISRLEPIESSESNESDCPSLSTSPSADSDEATSYKTFHKRACSDGRYAGHLLTIASRAAQKQLKEKSILQAAYINETTHQPVYHFAVDRESEPSASEEEAEPSGQFKNRGKDIRALRGDMKHYNISKQGDLSRRMSAKRTSRNATKPKDNAEKTKPIVSSKPRGPPMLGGDIVFPRAPSPKHTRFDCTQRPCARGAAAPSRQYSGLWNCSGTTIQRGTGGLWNGCCASPSKNSPELPKGFQKGVMTPRAESPDHHASPLWLLGPKPQLPVSPPPSDEKSEIKDVVLVEQNIEVEFDDAFITQIYNYLSLGYPALARKFDPELSKISKIPVEVIRQDDERKNTKGFVVPEGSGPTEINVKKCSRWISLKLYCLEWARQHPNMVESGGNSLLGATARKGSWAL